MSRWFTPRKPLALPPTTPSHPSSSTPSSSSSSSSSNNQHPYQHFESVHSHFPSLSSGGERVQGKIKDGLVEHYHFRTSSSSSSAAAVDGIDQRDEDDEERIEEEEMDLNEQINNHSFSEHSSSSSYNPQSKHLFRLIQHRRVLEIRSLSFVGSQHDKVLRLSFPTLIDELERNISYLHPLNEVLSIILTSSNGKETKIYRLDLPLEDGIVRYESADTWAQTVGIGGMEGYEVVSEKDVVVRAGNGLGRLNWDDENQVWQHIVLKTPSYLPSLSLSRFNPFSPPPTPNARYSNAPTSSSSSTSGIIAITSHVQDDQAWIYALFGDGKLRTWAMGSGVMVGGLDVGEGGKGLIRSFSGGRAGDEGHRIVIFSSSRFKVYTVSTEGEFGLRWIGTIDSPLHVGNGELRGMEVRDERLWTLWDVDGGRGVITWVDLSEILVKTQEEGLQMVGIGQVMNASTHSPTWKTSKSPLEESEPIFDSAYFEGLLPNSLHQNEDEEEDDSSDITDTFLEHLFFPGRFSMHTLQVSLEDYIESLAEREDLPRAVSEIYPTLLEKTKGIVECTVGRYADDHDGSDVVEQYRRNLKNEWLGLWALVQACDKQARWPVCLAEMGEGVVVVLKEGLVVPSRVDEFGLVIKLAGEQRDVESSWTDVGSRSSEVSSIPPGLLMKYYSTIAPPHVRTQLSSLIKISRSLSGRFSMEDLNEFEGEFFGRICQPLEQAPEEFGATLYQTKIRDQIALEDVEEELMGQLKACSPIHKGLNLILDLMMTSDLAEKSLVLSSYLGLAMSISALSQQVHVGYLVARDLLLLVLHVTSIINELEPGVDTDIYASLIARSMSYYQKFEALRWIVQQNGTEAQVAASTLAQPDENKDDLPFDFNELRMSGARSAKKIEVDPSTSYSLIHSVMASDDKILRMETGRVDYLLIACSALRHAISSPPNDYEVSASATDVVFANRLVAHGHLQHALMLIGRYPPQVGLTYVQAEAHARLDMIEVAVRGFEQVAAVFDTPSWLHGSGSRSGLERVLPNKAQWDISSYHHHVAVIFEKIHHTPSIIHFTKLAIKSAATRDPNTELLWTIVFRAYLESKRYEEAYVSMIRNPFADLSSDVSGKDRPLGNLINAMCHDNQVQRLLALSFIGYEDVIENELIFKARNSDPLAFPNYHQVLYAYYMQKKKYKDAGISMYQQGRRLGEHLHIGSDEFFTVATLQAQCYLAAIAAFSEVRPEHAWATLPVSGHSMLTSHTRKRRRLTVHIPATEFAEYSKDIEIVTLEDIRKDYALILATLKVASRFDMNAVDGPLPTPQEVVALQYEAGLYDDAFDTAHGLSEDMTPLFEHLTDRCLDLSDQGDDDDETGLGQWLFSSPLTCTWDGTTPDKAWRYLQVQLERHDAAKGSQCYVEAVTTRILARKHPLPVWLVKAELSRFPEGLIRKALEYGMVEMAIELSGECLKNPSQPTKLGEGGLKPVYTPFSLLDQVVVASSDERYSSPRTVQASSRLRTQIEKQIAMVKAVKV